MAVTQTPFGTNAFNEEVTIFTLTNSNDITATVMTHGATLVSLEVPDTRGNIADVVLGFDDIDGYSQGDCYFGATIGRFGNRIANGKFSLDGTDYSIAVNNGPNSLHGGARGFDKQNWRATVDALNNGVVFEYTSPDGEEGYPGTVSVSVTYSLGNDNALRIQYHATADAATPLNLTNHSYFNLAGDNRGYIGDQVLQLNASHYLPTDRTAIPTGEVRSVTGTPFDFTIEKPIGQDISEDNQDLKFGKGYDHNFCIDGAKPGEEPVIAAVAFDPKSGRQMAMFTDMPGVQLYTANWVSCRGKANATYSKRHAFCLETQFYPNCVNTPEFPSCILEPGHPFNSTTIYAFTHL